MKSFTCNSIILACCLGIARGFQLSTTNSNLGATIVKGEATSFDVDTVPTVERRKFVKDVVSCLSLPALLTGFSSPALADVSDGNQLPQGAAQFGRVLRTKSDLLEVQKRVAGFASEMDKKEWDNIGQFLRKVYATSEDMKSIASGFYDPEKKKKAAELIDSVKKVSKAADAPTGSQNGPEYLVYSKKLISLFDEFLGLLQDVPDEL